MIMQALLSIMAVMLLLQASPAEQAVVPTRVMPLFNGRDLTGWKADVPEKDTNPSAPDTVGLWQLIRRKSIWSPADAESVRKCSSSSASPSSASGMECASLVHRR